MKTLFKWAFRLVILMIILVVAAVMLTDTALKAFAERRIKDQTGLDVKIGNMQVSFLNRKVSIENFVVYNNADFGGSPMITMPELFLECDVDALQARKLSLKMARFNLSEINIVKNAAGKNNFEELMAKIDEGEKKAEKEGKKSVDTKVEFDGIGTLNLTLGKIIYTDMKNPAHSKEFEMGIKNQVVTGLRTQDDVQQKLMPVLTRGVTSMLFSGLISGDPTPLESAAPNSTVPSPAPAPRVVR
jgi:uncharacterized protein involved in outer membrane biogenesis